ncbi:PREDICTED: uncharacterized protein LOC109590204 [Amphimedon queenslandica]|uniref:Uncharacterized protein n=1 Tax=Amphimedon queenslandica TaxID=400682 RepID=A0AAN0JX56_AMPQE|nr:PREDICTED: uncharacterized protein LOC109590204 [Amphimedon queenslandica]|eukprot:XP_019861686.1 PREDICTED: uncharacterized protein LOC109590204 [Amphimedon queenslandica]
MAMSKQERPSMDDMQRQLRKFKEDPSQEVPVDVFHGLILHEKGSQDIVEGDGGCFSRAKGTIHQLSDGSTMRETKKNIVIKSIPNGDNPGRIEVQSDKGSKPIEFYSGEKIVEATDHEVIVAVPYGLDDDSEFHLRPKNTESDQYLMVNESQRCMCLKVKDGGNELVSLTVDEAEREKSCIHRYITVYQDDSFSSPNNIALFFAYKKANQKMYNCYLVPNDDSSKIDLLEIDVDGKNYDELRVLDEKYLKFSTSPKSLESTSDEERVPNSEPDKNIATGNNGASLTSSLSDHSVQCSSGDKK